MKFLKIALLALLLVGCGTAGRKQSGELKKFVKAGQLKKAETYVESEKFYPEEKDRLLKYLELGSIQYLNNNFYQALRTFDKAKELSDKLFTVSVSKKVKSAVSNSNYDNYYGEKFERSMIRFYQSLIHLKLSQVGKYEAHEVISRDSKGKATAKKPVAEKLLTDQQKAKHLSMASNVLIEWNSLLDNYKSTTGGKVTYKADLLASVFGAFIWEQLGKRTRAINLYKQAKDILFKNYNVLETYNVKSKKFRSDFSKLPRMSRKKVKLQYVQETAHAKMLNKYIDERIKELKKRRKDNLHVLIEKGFITPKKADKIDIPLPFTGKYKSAGGNFLKFCVNALGMATGSAPKIYFELPEIPFEPVQGQYILHVQSNGKTVKKKQLAVVNPLANLATLIMDQKSLSTKAKIGSRVAGKHIAALFAAYGTYQVTKEKVGDFLAMSAASLAYAGANKAIESSERADLRIWSLLPHHFRVTSLDLKPGDYQLLLEKRVGKQVTTSKLGMVSLTPDNKKMAKFVTYRTY